MPGALDLRQHQSRDSLDSGAGEEIYDGQFCVDRLLPYQAAQSPQEDRGPGPARRSRYRAREQVDAGVGCPRFDASFDDSQVGLVLFAFMKRLL